VTDQAVPARGGDAHFLRAGRHCNRAALMRFGALGVEWATPLNNLPDRSRD